MVWQTVNAGIIYIEDPTQVSVSHSLKKGQGSGQKKGTFDAWNAPKKGTFVWTDFSNVS